MGRNKIHRRARHFHRCEFFASRSNADRHWLNLFLATLAIAFANAGDIRADLIRERRATSRCFVQKENLLRDIGLRRQNRADVTDAIRRDRRRNLAKLADVSFARASRRCELNMDARPRIPREARCARRPVPRGVTKKNRRHVRRQIRRGCLDPSLICVGKNTPVTGTLLIGEGDDAKKCIIMHTK